jgi:hypothetical protein
MENKCEYKTKCVLGENCGMNCFEVEEGDFFYKGQIYSYKNNKITIMQKGLYQGADGNFYPYGGKTAEGAGAKDLWELIQFLYAKYLNQEGE